MSVFQPGVVRDELTRQLSARSTPLRAFLEDRFGGVGMYTMEHDGSRHPRRPWLIVPPGSDDEHAMRDAAEWLLRALVQPGVDLFPARAGAGDYRAAGIYVPDSVVDALGELVMPGADPVLLARACWALAGLAAARGLRRPELRRSPIGALPTPVSAEGLLGTATEGAVVQLAMFHHIYRSRLLPSLHDPRPIERRPGDLRLAGAKFVDTRPVLPGGGYVIEVTTAEAWVPFRRIEVYRLITYALLDFEDEFDIHGGAVFNVRYANLRYWSFRRLLPQLAGSSVDLADLRAQFRELLAASY